MKIFLISFAASVTILFGVVVLLGALPPAQSSLGAVIGPVYTPQPGTNVIMTDANLTLSAFQASNNLLYVTSSVALTATRNLIAPLTLGQTYIVSNQTTGGQSIILVGSSGGGVTIPNSLVAMVTSNGSGYLSTMNYITSSSTPPANGIALTLTGALSITASTSNTNPIFILDPNTSAGLNNEIVIDQPNAPVGSEQAITLGTPGNGNFSQIENYYAGNGSASNYLGLGYLTQPDIIKIFPTTATVFANGIVCSTSPCGFNNTTLTVPTSAIAANTCTSSATVTITGVSTASTIQISPSIDVSSVTGFSPSASGQLYFVNWPTANTVNYRVCNGTGSSITPSASTTWNVSAH